MILIATPNPSNPEHYLINPVKNDIGVWIVTNENAELYPHPYTMLLRTISRMERIR